MPGGPYQNTGVMDQRDAITRALMNIASPPPQSALPQMPQGGAAIPQLPQMPPAGAPPQGAPIPGMPPPTMPMGPSAGPIQAPQVPQTMGAPPPMAGAPPMPTQGMPPQG